jgi:hypothetical protein
MLSLQFGTKKKARQEVKREKNNMANNNNVAAASSSSTATATDEKPTSTFKRRGPRPKKNGGATNNNNNVDSTTTFSTSTTPASMDHVLETSIKESKEMSNQVDRAELFAGAKIPKKKNKTKKHRDYGHQSNNNKNKKKTEPTTTTPLTDQERAELAEIHADDKAVDAGLDILSHQVDSLMVLSKTMGETAQQQTSKLSTIHKDMDKADHKAQKINVRAKLFRNKNR